MPHLDRLLAFAIRRCDSVADAEDAVQDAFVRAWLGFADLRDDANARPWLYRILRTVLSDMREKTGRRQQLVFITRLEETHDELIGGEQDALFSEVVARLDGEAVHRALASIPEDFAAAVELHDIDGFKYAEIADIVGVPIGTVMSRIARGRKLLAGAIVAQREAAANEARTTDITERRALRGGPR
jgi:RNA polymerase sigma-70 factor (ECF subfamily)